MVLAIASTSFNFIDAIVVLPDHIHCLWTLPPTDADFSTRWRLIKSWFSRRCHLQYLGKVFDSRRTKGKKAVWQRRFWEHLIRDEQDFNTHVNYIEPIRDEKYFGKLSF